MGLDAVKTYVRARMLALGYTEWPDGFGFDNIPNTIMDDRWHMTYGSASTVKMNQQPLDIRWPFTLRLYRAGSRDPSAKIDQMVAAIDTTIKDLLAASNRTTYVGALKNVFLESFRIEKLGNTNDNGVLGIIEFSALVVIDID